MQRLPLSWVKPRRAVVAIVSTFSRSTSEVPRFLTEVFHYSSPHTSKIHNPDYLVVWLHKRAGVAEACVVIGCEGQRRAAHRSASDWRRKTIAVTYTSSALEATWTDISPWQTQAESQYKSALASVLFLLRPRTWCRDESTHLKEWSQLCPAPQSCYSSNLGSGFPLD